MSTSTKHALQTFHSRYDTEGFSRRRASKCVTLHRHSAYQFSGASGKESKSTSPHVGFYKSFSRPIAKAFLTAVFTYQAAYWLWLKLETAETQRLKDSEIQSLMSSLYSNSSKH